MLALVGRDVLRYRRTRWRVRDLSISRGSIAVDFFYLHDGLLTDGRHFG